MSGPRLTAAIRVSALLRRAEAAGGFATVLAKGDSRAGALLVICTQRGENIALLEQVLGVDGDYHWRKTAERLMDDEALFNEHLTKRRHNDPDLWLIELDVPDAERFAAELASAD